MIPERPFEPGDRFRDAARAYFVYGVIYWVGGVWLAFQGIGVRGELGFEAQPRQFDRPHRRHGRLSSARRRAARRSARTPRPG